jgi:hypothetical protein
MGGGARYPYPKEVWSPSGASLDLFSATMACASVFSTFIPKLKTSIFCLSSIPGGWWTRPSNWKQNTAVVGFGMILTCYALWTFSAEREVRDTLFNSLYLSYFPYDMLTPVGLQWRHTAPSRWIPSMMWSKQFKEGKLGIRNEDEEGSGDY